jgi:hypothetical protein
MDNLDPDPDQFADDKPKCMEYETALSLYLEARIRIRGRIKVKGRIGSGSASKRQAGYFLFCQRLTQHIPVPNVL